MSSPYRDSSAESAPPEIRVNGHATAWLSKGFPWVYPKEVTGRPRHLEPGDAVVLRGKDGRALGTGLWDEGWIAVRRFRRDVGPLDHRFLEERLRAALARRHCLLPPETSAWRAVHGENDALPGIRVDLWDRDATVHLDSPGLSVLLTPLVEVLRTALSLRSVHRAWRLDPRDDRPGPPAQACDLIWGAPVTEPVGVRERGARYAVRPDWGADAGLYPDMRDNRAWLEPLLEGTRLLNLFAYTGAFSVSAARAGASQVVTVDLSRPALERARHNFTLNGLDPAPHPFEQEDAFRALDRYRRQGARFDRIIADVPSFSHSPSGAFSVGRDLARLVAATCRVLAPAGLLAVASNAGALGPRDFVQAIRKGARKARRPLRLVHTGSPPPDYPADPEFPESRYLKFMVWVG